MERETKNQSKTVGVESSGLKYFLSDIRIGLEWEPQFTALRYQNMPVLFRYISDAKQWSISVEDYERDNDDVKEAVIVTVPKSHLSHELSIDGDNLEIRTLPVLLNVIEEEIDRAFDTLKGFSEKLFYVVGPLAVFLPASKLSNKGIRPVSKHVNYSFKQYAKSKSNPFRRSGISLDGSLYKPSTGKNERGVRWHLFIPYNFMFYTKLAEVFVDYGNTGEVFEKLLSEEKAEVSITAEDILHHNKCFAKITDIVSKWHEQQPMDKPIMLGYVRTGKFVVRHRLI